MVVLGRFHCTNTCTDGVLHLLLEAMQWAVQTIAFLDYRFPIGTSTSELDSSSKGGAVSVTLKNSTRGSVHATTGTHTLTSLPMESEPMFSFIEVYVFL